MSTASQIANAANAQLSTGPRTEKGKHQSSQNARTHGLSAQHSVISEEDHAAFHQLREQLHAETKPQGALQEIIFEGLVHSAWNLRRVRAMEAELNAFAPGAPLPDDAAAKLDSLARHHSRIERAFFRSLRELKALQTDAAISLTLPPYFMTIAPPLASRTQNCKTNPIPGNQRSRFGSGRLPLSPRSGRRSPGPRPAPPHPRRGRRAYRACHVGELDYRDEPSQLFRSRAPIVNAPT